ncbi:MAG: hypothetical protein R3F41_09380 [Gammaproteobacteria bacterium]|nr:hypothetical protein [Pseudomonadales bacterium]MCP5347813.1 hypothetical protein [Pseudomonadales bacterium]
MAFTEQDQQDLMYIIVGTFNAAPGRTIFNQLAASMINDGATIADIANALVNHPIFSDNTIGEYPVSQTNQQFATEYLTELLGAPGELVEATLWDQVIDIAVAALNGGATRAELVLAATQFLQTTTDPNFADAAQALENKVDVALYQAVVLEQDGTGSSLDDLRAPLAGIDETDASVDAAKAEIDAGLAGDGTSFTLTAGTAAGADVMRITGDQDVRIDFTDASNQITGLDLDGDGKIENDGKENNISGMASGFEIVDAYARNPLNHYDSTNNFLGDINFDGTGVDGDGVSTDGNIVLGGLGADNIFGGIGNDFLAGGGVAMPTRYLDLDGDGDLEPSEIVYAFDALHGGRNADFFFASLAALSSTDGDNLFIDGGSTTDDATPEGGAQGVWDFGAVGSAFNILGNGDYYYDGFNYYYYDEFWTEDYYPETNQDSDWLLLEASDDDEPVEIWLGGWNGSDESQTLTTRSGVSARIVEIEHVDASGNLYGFLDDMDTVIGERAGKDTHAPGSENTAIGASAQLIIYGSDDDNIIIGGFDNDLIHGEDGDDLLFGGRMDYNNNPNLTGIKNDGMDEIYGGYGDDDIAFEVDGGVVDGESGDDTLWLTELTFGTQTASDLTTDSTVRIDLNYWQGYGGANFTTWTQDHTNYKSSSNRVDVDNMENVIATGMGSIDYRAAGTNDPELSFNNQQNIGAIDAHVDLRGTSGNNWLLAASGDDVIEGRGGDDILSGGEGSDDFIFFLGNVHDSGEDGVDKIQRQTDADNDNVWDGGWSQDFGLDTQSTASDSSFTLGIPDTLAPYVDGVRFELDGTEYVLTGLTADDFDTFLDNLTDVVSNTAGLEDVSVSSPANGVAVLTDASGGTFVELTANGWILTSGSLPSDGLDQWYQEVGAPTVETSEDRLVYQSYEDRLDGERVDDDSVLGSSISLGEDHYAEDLVISFSSDGTRIAEDQLYRINFTNLTTEDTVTIEINGVTYCLQVGVDIDGNIVANEDDVLGESQATIQANFLNRYSAFINSFMDDDTAAGQVNTWVSGSAIMVQQTNYNGEETVFMNRPMVTIDQNSLGEIATVAVSNQSQHEVHLLDFDGRDNNLNFENVLFWGDQEINRATLETAAEAGDTIVGSEAILIDGGANDLQSTVQGSGAAIFDNMTTNAPLTTNFSVHGDDLLLGGSGDDVISGGTGDDRVIGSLGDDEVDGGKNFYRVQVLGEQQARVYELNAYEAANFSIPGQVIVSLTAIAQSETGTYTVSGIFDDTLQFQQADFEAGVTEFTITLNNYQVSGSSIKLINDGAGTVAVDTNADGIFESVTEFTNFENVRTVSGVSKAVAGDGQGNDTLNVNGISDDTGGVAFDITNNINPGQVRYSANAVDVDPYDVDGTFGQSWSEYESFVMRVDGVENVISGDGDDLVVIDETEAAKNNMFLADLGFDRIDYRNAYSTNALVAEPTVTVKVNTSSNTDEVVMTAGRVGTTVATDTLESVEVIGLNGNTARSVREDDVLDVTAMTTGAVIDFVMDEVRDLAGNVQVYIENMSELENVWADGDDVVIVGDSMDNSREDAGDGTASMDLQLFTFLDYDEGKNANSNDTIDLTSATAVRQMFANLLPGDINNTLNQNQFTFDMSKTGGGNDDDIVDYSAEMGTIVSVTDFGDTDDDHYILVDHNGDLDLTDTGDRVDHLISVEGVVASAGTSIIDLTNLNKDIELRYQKVAEGTAVSENVAMPNTIAVDLLFIDQDTNSAFNDFRYIEYYDNPNVGGDAGETAHWNQVEGSDRDEKIEMTSDQLDSRHTFNLRGGDNEINYNEQQSRGIEVSIDDIANGITKLDIAGKDNAGMIVSSNGNGKSDKVTSYNNTSTIAGSLRIEASQSEDDSINLGSVLSNNLFVLGAQEGSDDVVEVVFDVDGGEVGLTLTGFEVLMDSQGDDVYEIDDITNILNTLLVMDNVNPDFDTLKLLDGALENFAGGNFGDGSIEVDDLEDSIDGTDDNVENFDFSALDISEVTEQIDYVVTNDAGETLILGNLDIFGDQGDANIDVQTFETIEFTSTDGMGNNVVIDMDLGEFRQSDGDILFTFDSATTFDFSAITEDMVVSVIDTAMVGVTVITDAEDTITGGGGDDFITGGADADVLDGGIVPEVLETRTFDFLGSMGSDGSAAAYIEIADVDGDWIRFHQDGSITTASGNGDQPAATTGLTASASADLVGSTIATHSAAVAAELSENGLMVQGVSYDGAGIGGTLTVTYASGENPAAAGDLTIEEVDNGAGDSTLEANTVAMVGGAVDSAIGSEQADQMDSSDTFIYNDASESTESAMDMIINFTVNSGGQDDVIDLSALDHTHAGWTNGGSGFADFDAAKAAAQAWFDSDGVSAYVGSDGTDTWVFHSSDTHISVDNPEILIDLVIELTGIDATGIDGDNFLF